MAARRAAGRPAGSRRARRRIRPRAGQGRAGRPAGRRPAAARTADDAFTTAADPDAPPIVRWDREDERCPVAWYVYTDGSSAHQWGLQAGSWAEVDAVVPLPTTWGSRPSPHLGEGHVLVLRGASDSRRAEACLFPEILRDDLHGVRAVIEEHCRTAKLQQVRDPACGWDVRKGRVGAGGNADPRIRALTAGRWSRYQVDRWD